MILDIVLIILFLLMILYGYKKGCIGIVAKLVSLIIAFVLAYFLAQTVGNYIANTDLGANIATRIESKVLDSLNGSSEKTVVSIVQEQLNLKSEETIIPKIVEYVFTGVGFIVIFVVSRIILWIAQKILESIFELPILKTFNKLGGVITAAILYIVEISILLAVINSISTLSFMEKIVGTIQSSVITKVLYDHNIFTNLILSKII